jgi:hypothetical protein
MHFYLFTLVSLLSIHFSQGRFGLKFLHKNELNRKLTTITESFDGSENEELVYSYGDEKVYLVQHDDPSLEEDKLFTIYESEVIEQHLDSPYLWNLDRIDNNCGNYNQLYRYHDHVNNTNNSTINEIISYVIDTGVSDHEDLGDRLIGGKNMISLSCSDEYTDNNGHGTFVSTQIAGSYVGSCKEDCEIYSIKVLNSNGSGSSIDVIRGIFHAVQHYKDNNITHAIINLSIGGSFSQAVNNAVAFAVEHEILTFVAAGNSNNNACLYSPASESSAWTIGASTKSDKKAYFSNYGQCVDTYGPGVGVLGGNYLGGFSTLSGTSMSTPTVAGLIAKYWFDHSEKKISQLYPVIKSLINPSMISGLPIISRPINATESSDSVDEISNGNFYEFDRCFQYSAEIESYTTKKPAIGFQLLKTVKSDICAAYDTYTNFIITNKKLLKRNHDEIVYYKVDRGNYLNMRNKSSNEPFRVKIYYNPENFILTLFINDKRMYQSTFDNTISKVKLFSRQGTIVNYNIIDC